MEPAAILGLVNWSWESRNRCSQNRRLTSRGSPGSTPNCFVLFCLFSFSRNWDLRVERQWILGIQKLITLRYLEPEDVYQLIETIEIAKSAGRKGHEEACPPPPPPTGSHRTTVLLITQLQNVNNYLRINSFDRLLCTVHAVCPNSQHQDRHCNSCCLCLQQEP